MGTGVLELLGGESGTGVYGVAQTRTRLLGRRTLNPQAAKQVLSECTLTHNTLNHMERCPQPVVIKLCLMRSPHKKVLHESKRRKKT